MSFEPKKLFRTAQGEIVRTKAEVIIADRLNHFKLTYAYEKPLTFGGQTHRPDFTIDGSGRTYYWEHSNLPHVPEYQMLWKVKQRWYKANGVRLSSEGDGNKGTLIMTDNDISAQFIDQLIRNVILKD